MAGSKITLQTSVCFNDDDKAAAHEYFAESLQSFCRTVNSNKEFSTEVDVKVTLPSKTLLIIRNDFPQNPCEEDEGNPFIFFWNHKRYIGGHKGATSPWINDDPNKDVRDDVIYCLTVYGYEHGGLTISTSPFTCRFDSGIIGAIYMTRKSRHDSGCAFKDDADVYEKMKAFIKTYDLYLQNECWDCFVVDEEGDSEYQCSFNNDSLPTDIENCLLSQFTANEIQTAWENRQ